MAIVTETAQRRASYQRVVDRTQPSSPIQWEMMTAPDEQGAEVVIVPVVLDGGEVGFIIGLAPDLEICEPGHCDSLIGFVLHQITIWPRKHPVRKREIRFVEAEDA